MKRCLSLIVLLLLFSMAAAANARTGGVPAPVLEVNFDNGLDALGPQGTVVPPEMEGVDSVAGKAGQAGRFIKDKLSFARYPGRYLNLEEGSMSIWIRLNAPSTDMGVGSRWIIDVAGYRGNNLIVLNDRIRWQSLQSNPLGWKAGEWHHLAVTWQPRESGDFPYRYDLAIYIDGVGAVAGTVAQRPWKRGDVTLGSYPVTSYGRKRNFELQGDLDEFMLYHKALTPRQIALLAGLSVRRAAQAALPRQRPIPTGLNLRRRSSEGVENKGAFIGLGHPAVILVAPDAGGDEKAAAGELSEYLERITGLPVRVLAAGRQPEVKGQVLLLVGGGAARFLGVKVPQDLSRDEIYIRGEGDKLILAGGGQDGLFYAVCELLEGLGVRWYSPGAAGTLVPRRQRVRLPLGEQRLKPFFLMRVDQPCGSNGEPIHDGNAIRSWLRHRRTQGYMGYSQFHRMVTKELRKVVPESLFAEHPEYFGMNDVGLRQVPARNNINPCTSNPAVSRMIEEIAVSLLRANPAADYFTIEPIDGGGWCQCAACKALDAEPGNYTDRVVALGNRLAAAIEAAFPGQNKGARFFAYQGYSYPPRRERPAANLQVELTNASGEMAAGWAEHARNLQRWSYYGYWSYHWGPLPGLYRIVDEARTLKKYGFQGWFNEGAETVMTMAAPYSYIMSKLMWDPDADVGVLLDDFFSGYYGPAAAPMRRCFDLLEERHRSYSSFQTWDFDPMALPSDTWEKCLAWTMEADALAGGDAWLLRHIRTARLGFLTASLARDTLLAQQYQQESDHPFWKDLAGRREGVTERLIEVISLARELKITSVRSTVNDPASLETMAAMYASALKLDIGRIERLFSATVTLPAKPVQPEAKWELVFADDFQRRELGGDWKVTEGNLSIDNGVLTGKGEFYIDRRFPGDQCLEYEAWVNPGDAACDLSAILGCSGNNMVGGYFFGFGSNGNGLSKLMKERTVLFSTPQAVILPGKRHRITCRKEGNTLTWMVDGQEIMRYSDIRPLQGEHIGLYIYTIGQIDNVKVFIKDKAGKEK